MKSPKYIGRIPRAENCQDSGPHGRHFDEFNVVSLFVCWAGNEESLCLMCVIFCIRRKYYITILILMAFVMKEKKNRNSGGKGNFLYTQLVYQAMVDVWIDPWSFINEIEPHPKPTGSFHQFSWLGLILLPQWMVQWMLPNGCLLNDNQPRGWNT